MSKGTKQTAVYMRTSTSKQRDRSQRHALQAYVERHDLPGVKWYKDTGTGGTLDRSEFEKLQRAIRAGKVGTVIVWKLDRLSRSLRDGINTLSDWLERGVRVVAVTQDLDFSGATGKLIASVLLAVAEMEREAIRERTRAGLDAARAAGKTLGRPKGCKSKWNPAKRKVDPDLAAHLRNKGVSITDIAAKFKCSRAAVYQALKG